MTRSIDLEGARCQSVTLVSLLLVGRAGIIGEQCGLGQSKSTNTIIHRNKKNTEKLQSELQLVIDKSYHEKITLDST